MTRLMDHARAFFRDRGRPNDGPSADTKLIIADPVYLNMLANPKRSFVVADFPNIAPPFRDFFVEARWDKDPEVIVGIWAVDVSEASNAQPRPEKRGGVRWIIRTHCIMSDHGEVSLFPGFGDIYIDAEGRGIGDEKSMLIYVDEFWEDYTDKELAARNAVTRHEFAGFMPVFFQTVALLHCKNVTIEEGKEPRGERRRFEKKTGLKPSIHHVLKIKPMGQRTAAQHSATPSVGLTRWHIMRGHFKTFTEDKPLFGKWSGVYWWGESVRGNATRGKVEKDYEVEPRSRHNQHIKRETPAELRR